MRVTYIYIKHMLEKGYLYALTFMRFVTFSDMYVNVL